MSGIETSYAHGEPCMYATSGSGRVMKSPSRGTIRSWPVRPGKYARANISRKRCRAARAAAPAGAVARIRGASLTEDRLTCWPETVQAIATRVRARRTAPEAVNFEEITKVRTRSNDPSPATRPTRGADCNQSAMAGFAAAHG